MPKIKRPLLLCSSFFCISVFLSFFVTETFRFAFAVILAAAFLVTVIICAAKRSKNYALPVAFICASLGAVITILFLDINIKNTENRYAGMENTYTVHISDVTYRSSYYSVMTGKITSVGGEKCNIKTEITLEGEFGGKVGQDITVKGTLEEISGDYATYNKGNGIFFSLSADEITEYGDINYGFRDYFTRFSSVLAARLKVLCGNDGSLASGVFLGDRSYLDEKTKSDFSSLGISHILAVSGLHLSVIAGLFDFIISRITKKKYIIIPLDIIVIISFALLTGLRYSVLRASVMALIMFISRHFGRAADPLTSLSAACLLIVAVNPYAVLDCGFILSVSAVLGLLTVGAPISAYIGKKVKSKVLSFILSSLAATFSVLYISLPAVYFFYGEFAPSSFIANIVFIPLTTVILVLTPITLAVTFISPVLKAVCSFTLYLASLGADILPGKIYINYAFVPYCIVLSLVIFVIFIIKSDTEKRKVISCIISPVILAVSVLICGIAVSVPYKNAVRAVLLTDGTNDGIVAKYGSTTVYIDNSAGGTSSAESFTEAGLDAVCDTDIDIVIYTHVHSKHTGQLKRLCDIYGVSAVYIPESADPDIISALEETATEGGATLTLYGDSTVLDINGFEISFEKSCEIKDRAHRAICFNLSHGQSSLSFASLSYIKYLESDSAAYILSHGGGFEKETELSENLLTASEKISEKTGIAHSETVNSGKTEYIEFILK